ncbi:dihydropteroate synthase [Roseobacter sinensis]|uniref:Dihydropteroate synthase n=1 Tax=Roseobacter sinensis TaxID=2931391 RepID=A0ABT3B9Z0_9RHOB|nr:dihydropteroate synthase [Roseobacter sp. WL0113]MCV3270360.1 dihydropteroate synthase [Roseobacter sp. WL0113]
MDDYLRPIVQTDVARPTEALPLAGGWGWFTQLEVLRRDAAPRIVAADTVDPARLDALTTPRAPIAGLTFDRPRIMGILNVTPDSFSDGGKHASVEAARAAAMTMQAADIIDIGGESTRPGAATVPAQDEISRTAPVIAALKAAGVKQLLSIDTRKAGVAEEALAAGATLVNDVSGFTFDPALASVCARHAAPVCVMHTQGDPETMQRNPQYDDVLLDVYDVLATQIEMLERQGIPRAHIIADPGIGFGKTLPHNLALLARLSLFHGLGVPLLLGASRKGFIGTLGAEPQADRRLPGSLAVALAALKHGTQIVRVHDVPETAQAIALWRASVAGCADG